MNIQPKLFLLIAVLCPFGHIINAQVKTKTPVATKPPAANTQELPINNGANMSLDSADAFSRFAVATFDTAFESKLVMLAMKVPSYRASDHRNKINEYELKKAKNSWLNLLAISTNYNDQTFSKTSPTATTAYVYPKYFLGITIPLGVIFSQGTQVKSAREAVALSRETQADQVLTIKSAVTAQYRQYQLFNGLIDMQSELMSDVIANASQAEASFRKNAVPVETYINAQKIKNEEAAKYLQLKYQQDVVKLELERMIGMTLEQARATTVTTN